MVHDPELAEARRRDRPLIAIVIVGMLMLGGIGISAATYGRSDSSARAARAAQRNTVITEANARRTECVRAISSELDHARWQLIGDAFNATSRADARAIGQKFTNMPLLSDLANRGGEILGEHVDACPPIPLMPVPRSETR